MHSIVAPALSNGYSIRIGGDLSVSYVRLLRRGWRASGENVSSENLRGFALVRAMMLEAVESKVSERSTKLANSTLTLRRWSVVLYDVCYNISSHLHVTFHCSKLGSVLLKMCKNVREIWIQRYFIWKRYSARISLLIGFSLYRKTLENTFRYIYIYTLFAHLCSVRWSITIVSHSHILRKD